MPFISDEIPSGIINSVNNVFTLSQTISQIDDVIVDGADYAGNVTVAGNQITLADAPTSSIYVDYWYGVITPTVGVSGTTLGALLTTLTRRFGNSSTKYYTNEDRVDALNWARTQLSFLDFPELMVTSTLNFNPITFNGVQMGQSSEPGDLNRYLKIWDTSTQEEYIYIEPDQFDMGGYSSVFTRMNFTDGNRYTFVQPNTISQLAVRYFRRISPFGTNGSQNNEFDPYFDDVLIEGAVQWLAMKGRDIAEISEFTQSYQDLIMKMFQNQRRQGGRTQQKRLTFYGEKFPILNYSSLYPWNVTNSING